MLGRALESQGPVLSLQFCYGSLLPLGRRRAGAAPWYAGAVRSSLAGLVLRQLQPEGEHVRNDQQHGIPISWLVR